MLTMQEAVEIVKRIADGRYWAVEHRIATAGISITVAIHASACLHCGFSCGPDASYDDAIAKLRARMAAASDAAPPTVRTGDDCDPSCNRECDDCTSCDSRCADLRQPDRRGEDDDDCRGDYLHDKAIDDKLTGDDQ